MIYVTTNIQLEESALQFTAVKAGGPGGQHVNATSSAVQLKFDAVSCDALSPSLLNRLRNIAGSRMTREGVIVLHESGERSQHRNKATVQERLLAMIRTASVPPKYRRKTRPTKGSVTKRLTGKTHNSKLKKTRGRVSRDD